MSSALPLAEAYAQLLGAGRVRERLLLTAERTPSELELQARWFAGEFGRRFTSSDGDDIEIVQFGIWNREAGPDFSEAVIQVNGGEPARGSVEFDLSDRSWEAHGHALNPAFESTVLHVFVHASEQRFFSRTLQHRNVPQVRVDLAKLPDAASVNVPLAHPGRCHAPLQDLPEARVRSIVQAAAQFRLTRKAARLGRLIGDCGRDETLFSEIAAALGYKQNKLPFTLLAQRLPLKHLRENPASSEALLFGLASFLRQPDLALLGQPTRAYVRSLWDRWWPHRDSYQRLILPEDVWEIAGTRPLNHPQRRVAALALLAENWPAFLHSLGDENPGTLVKFFHGLRHPFWNFHYTLTSSPSAKEMALVGDTRIADIRANVIIPYQAAEGVDVWKAYSQLPAQLTNRRVETAAARLFADDPRRPEFLKKIAHQQGLLQIYEDFCLQDNSDCFQCPFPEQMLRWK